MFNNLVVLAIIVAVIAGFWKVFEKAGKPGTARWLDQVVQRLRNE